MNSRVFLLFFASFVLGSCAIAEGDRRGALVVSSGIDVLRSEDFTVLQGKRVGLITNHTGRAADGETTIDLLHEAAGVELVSLFSPEHGIRGAAENGVVVEDGLDAATGLPVSSLYGETKRPSSAQLAGLDVLVFDIQDIGARFYTYIATMGLAMEAAAEAGIAFVVLDRPNPIGGTRLGGPLPDGALKFVCPHDIPIRHGMTVGELALMFRQERDLDLDLKVVEMRGWERGMWFDDTGLPWRAPSPNMPDLEAAALYPGIGILEFLNLSVGRGTEAPFRIVGAPFIDGVALAEEVLDAGLEGLQVEPVRFTPSKSKFAGEECGGVRLRLTDRDPCDVLRLGAVVGAYLFAKHADEVDFLRKIDVLLVHPESVERIAAGKIDLLLERWAEDGRSFRERRQAFLLY